MEENRKTLKVYHGIIMLILSAVCVFFVSPILGANLGLYGTLLNEILLLYLRSLLLLLSEVISNKSFQFTSQNFRLFLGRFYFGLDHFLQL